MGRPTRKTAADPFEFQKLSRSEEFRKQEDSRTGSRRYILGRARICLSSRDRRSDQGISHRCRPLPGLDRLSWQRYGSGWKGARGEN